VRPLPSDLVNDWLARVVAAARGGLTPAAQRFAALGLMVISEGLEVLPEDPWAAPRLARGVGPVDGLLVRLSRPVDMLEQDGPPEHRVAALEMVARLAVQILAAPDLDGFHRPGGDVLLPQAPGPAPAEPVNLSTPALGCTLGCEVEGCEQTFARPGPLGEFLSSVFKGGDEVDLTKADIIVAAGRGVGGQDKMGPLEELAKALGGELGASRPVIDSGWLERERQIGSSGQTVAPKLYLAVGISGAIQHLVGMKGSGCIVAINKDPSAPIFGIADYGIVGDLHEVVPALTAAVEEAKA